MADVFRERLVELARFRFEHAFGDFNSALTKLRQPGATHQRIWVADRNYHALDAGRDHRFGAGTCAPGVRARLQIEIQSRVSRSRASLFHSQHLSVFSAIIGMRAPPDDLAR